MALYDRRDEPNFIDRRTGSRFDTGDLFTLMIGIVVVLGLALLCSYL